MPVKTPQRRELLATIAFVFTWKMIIEFLLVFKIFLALFTGSTSVMNLFQVPLKIVLRAEGFATQSAVVFTELLGAT